MNKRARSLSRIIKGALVGMIALVLVLLILPGALPIRAAWQPGIPDAITNPQKAAILGSQNLLQLNQIYNFIYLPTLHR